MSVNKHALLDEYAKLLQTSGGKVITDKIADVSALDVLIVVDMQNDFVPVEDAPKGGKFGVAEGASASQYCVKLIEAFARKGSKIVASKDYHPDCHVSFNTRNGPFPPHCIQGSPGSAFFPPVRDALMKVKSTAGSNLHIVHKGFHEDIDSFGAFPYKKEQVDSRPLSCANRDCCPLWTGGYELKCSSQDQNIDAPPDILSILPERRKTMKEVIDSGARGDPLKQRIFVCGLAMDFCCLDTIVNAGHQGYSELYLVLDATRAAHVPGAGKYGSGFLTNPADMVKLMTAAKAKIVRASAIGIK
uniref:nicotinamidase n=1 Tax=Tetraselmis sp. GSL018 TaxID=582737 RepID=A0A061RZG6_9CHLO